MNINNINSPQKIPGSTGNVTPSQQKNADQPSAPTATQQPGETRSVRDTYAPTGGQKYIDDMTDRALAINTEPRTEMVDQARERAKSGFYDSQDIYITLAQKLTDSESPDS